MKSKYRVTITLLLLTIFVATAASAEVSVREDRRGNYLTTVVIPLEGEDGTVLHWTTRGPRTIRLGLALNPYGDEYGDGAPVVLENTVGRLPWAVWNRTSGSVRELVYSYWTSGGWAPSRPVAIEPPPGVNADPSLGFDDEGRPYLSWWAEDEHKGRVYVSVFLAQGWMTPVLVSDSEIDSRHPTLSVLTRDARTEPLRTIRVVYETEDGRVQQDVTFSLPDTITDDINPMGIVYRGEPVPVSEQQAN